ncbi:MAG: membrane protein insertion efficiency factor YidD [bacterium]
MSISGSSVSLRQRLAWGTALAILILIFQTDFPIRFEIGVISLYRKNVSPVTRHIVTCRFETSCSSYALQALEESGFWAGNSRIAERLLMCSPIGYLIDTFDTCRSGRSQVSNLER